MLIKYLWSVAAACEMGAAAADIVTDVERNDDGSVKVAVSWAKPAVAGGEGPVPGGQPL